MNRNSYIDSLRCVCNYMIVLLHGWAAYQYCNNATLEYRIWDCICNVLMSSALSVLFFISGYLLMHNFNMSSYGDKIKRRIKRLVVPYVVWNACFVVIYLSLANMFPRLNDRVVSYGLGTWLGTMCKIISFAEAPIDGPLWFMRALFLYSLCAPIIYCLEKVYKGVILIALIVCWMMLSCFMGYEREFTHTYPAYSMLAFVFGGLCSGKVNDIFCWFRANRKILVVAGIAGFIGLLYCRECHNLIVRYMLWDVSMLLSGALLMGLADYLDGLITGHRIFGYFRNASFFVYAGHFLFCSIPLHLIAGKLHMIETGKVTILILGVFFGIGLTICFSAYSVGKRLLGRPFSVFDGTM